jgi:peptidoglycan/xylan/chitin deacetylase (PgdA/CDA1 family)
LAEELSSRQIPATFYVPITGEAGKPVLTMLELRGLPRQGFEIGAHTLTHQILPELHDGELEREIRVSKHMLEQWLGCRVQMFCYPRGRYNNKVIKQVKASGFDGARTTRMLSHAARFSPFEMPTSLQAYPHPHLGYLRHLGKRHDLTGIAHYLGKYSRCKTWVEVGKRLFDDALLRGGVWHLYGHSWEIEELALWNQLQEMLDYVKGRPGVVYATNSGALKLVCEQVSGRDAT